MRYSISHNRPPQATHSGKAKLHLSTRQRKKRTKAAQTTKTSWSDLGILSETWSTVEPGGDKSVVSSITAEQRYSNLSTVLTETNTALLNRNVEQLSPSLSEIRPEDSISQVCEQSSTKCKTGKNKKHLSNNQDGQLHSRTFKWRREWAERQWDMKKVSQQHT